MSAIAAVSVAGIAIATAAVVCVLSVFNGFRSLMTEKFDILAPDVLVTPAKGKVIADPDSVISLLQASGYVKSVMPVVSDKALAIYEGRELPVTIKGLDPEMLAANSRLSGFILEGGEIPSPYYEEMPEFEYLEDYEEYMANTPRPQVLASLGAAVRLGNVYENENILLFAPRREGRYNPANPAASFVADSVTVSGIYETKQREYDEDMIIAPIGLARHLFQYDDQATSLEAYLQPGIAPEVAADKLRAILGPAFVVRDRSMLQEVNFRMVNIEKWVSFLLLVFILLIAGFNIISTMTMLIIEKRRSMSIMNALGMGRRRLGGIFSSESVMVSLLGGVIGIALGVLLCWLQQEFGLVKLQGDPSKLLISEYPVKLIWSDVALAFAPSVVLGLLTALIAGAFARSRISPNPSGVGA